MKLADILGYRLDMARHAAMRSVHRQLADCALKPADTTALLLVRDQPGCDQATLGRALSGNRSVGMKVASRLEAMQLIVRGPGSDRRKKGLHITTEGKRVLDDAIQRHEKAEAVIARHLHGGERDLLLRLLLKIERAVREDEADSS